MITRPLAAFLAAILALGAPLEAVAQTETRTFNQEGEHNKRDDKKAQKLADDIYGWDELTPEEQQAVLTYIAIDLHGRRRKARSASIKTKTGKDLDANGDNFGFNGKDKKPLTIGGHEVVYSEQTVENIPDKQVPYSDEIPIKPVNFKDVFKDNSWELKNESAVRAQIADAFTAFDAYQAANKGKPAAKAQIGEVHIMASASTVFNNAYKTPGDPSTRLTHRELSRARANTIHRIVRDELTKRGVLTDGASAPAPDDFAYADEDETPEQSAAVKRQIFTLSAGDNGNGTSGPDSPYNCPTWKVPGAISSTGVASKDPKVVAAVKDFSDKFCVKGDGPASAQAKEWARLEGMANAKQDTAAADSYAKLIEDEYEPHRYVVVDFKGSATVSGTKTEKGSAGKAEILLVNVSYKSGGGKTRTWKTVKVKRRKTGFFTKVLCALHLKRKSKCPPAKLGCPEF